MGQPHGVGIVGLGVIAAKYLDTLAGHPDVAITAVADLDHRRASEAASRIPGCRALPVADLVADDAVETVLNLTTPEAHAEVALAALAQGRNVYGEKPLAATLLDALSVMDARGRAWVGAAPDTVLGTGIQTARDLVDSGRIGRPVAAFATWVAPGHERWHPNPDFYYRAGGGPLLDMGPYYLTALVQILGPVVRVMGATSRAHAARTIGSGPRAGERIPVEVDTHVTGVLEHANGALSTLVVSFDAVATQAAPIEIHGDRGSLSVPDPNRFDGTVRIRLLDDPDWADVPASAGYQGAERGIGLLDFVAGHGRAGGDMALHVLEIMTALLTSADDGVRVSLDTSVGRPPLVPFTPEEVWRGRQGARGGGVA